MIVKSKLIIHGVGYPLAEEDFEADDGISDEDVFRVAALKLTKNLRVELKFEGVKNTNGKVKTVSSSNLGG